MREWDREAWVRLGMGERGTGRKDARRGEVTCHPRPLTTSPLHHSPYAAPWLTGEKARQATGVRAQQIVGDVRRLA